MLYTFLILLTFYMLFKILISLCAHWFHWTNTSIDIELYDQWLHKYDKLYDIIEYIEHPYRSQV